MTGKLLTSHGATCQQCRQDVTKLIVCEAKKGLGGGHGIYPSFCTSPAPRPSGVHPTWVSLSPDACSCVLLCKVPAI